MIGSVIWFAGLAAAGAAIALSHQAERVPDPRDAGFPTMLNQMLIRVMGWAGIVMLVSLSVYLSGVVIPALSCLIIYLATRILRLRADLVPYYRFQVPLAVTGLVAGLFYWLSNLGVKEPFHV